jgi:hypothetical protein
VYEDTALAPRKQPFSIFVLVKKLDYLGNGGTGSGIGSGESWCAALRFRGLAITRGIGGTGSGIGSGESCCAAFAVRGLALAANMRSANAARRADCFDI